MVLLSVQLVFIVTHWEKYNTGILYLSWGYDASQWVGSFSYVYKWVLGTHELIVSSYDLT